MGYGHMSLLPFLFLLSRLAAATIRVTKDNASLSFASTEATFAPRVWGPGICGFILLGNPLDACSTLHIQPSPPIGSRFPFILISRGNCSFDTKVRIAQKAGFQAAIIFDNEDSPELITMAGTTQGIYTYAVFVSKKTGSTLQKYVGDPSVECWLCPSKDILPWSFVFFSLVSFMAIACIIGTCCIVRTHRMRHSVGSSLRSKDSYGISSEVVKSMPTLIYKSLVDDNHAEDTCAICLEDYLEGDKLRLLPCCHKFHSSCIDAWLIMWRSFCPLCKRDVHTEESETTPLLGSPSIASLAIPTDPSPDSLSIQVPHPIMPSDHLNMPLDNTRSVCLSNHLLPPRPRVSSEVAPLVATRHPSLQAIRFRWDVDTLDSLEAFRASPYFAPPSLSRNVSPHVSNSDLPPFIADPYEGYPLTQSLPEVRSHLI